jgi:protein ImuA
MAGDPLSVLRERVRRIERPAAAMHGVLPFGIAAIDAALPYGGLLRGAVHEILGAGGDEEDGALAAAFAAAILGRLGGAVLWCLPRPDLYGPGLAALGLDPGRLVLAAAHCDIDLLWAMEEGLRSPSLAAVVGEIGCLAAVASRRLQLAAERSGVTGLVLRRWRTAAEAARERGLPNAAVTRWRVAALPSATNSLPSFFKGPLPPLGGEGREREAAAGGGSPPHPALSPSEGEREMIFGEGRTLAPDRKSSWVGAARWRVELLRCRGGEPAAWELEVSDATGALSLAAALADRSPAPQPWSPVRDREFRRAG